MPNIFKQKERQIYYDQRVFIESIEELRASFKFYNPDVNAIGVKTIQDYFSEVFTEYIKQIAELQKKSTEKVFERLIYANQNFNFDFEQCLKARLEILKKNLNFQYLHGKRYAEFFAEMTDSEQNLPKIVFPKGYEREAFPSLGVNKANNTRKKRVYRGEEVNRDQEELMHSLDEVLSPLEMENPKTMDLRIKGTLLGYNVKDKVVVPAKGGGSGQSGEGEDIPPGNIEIGDRVFEMVEKLSNVLEIKNYKLNLSRRKSNGKWRFWSNICQMGANRRLVGHRGIQIR